jgi:superoxide dismutase, Fe-Mn family
MTYNATQFDHLLGLAGFSDEMVKNHLTLYEGYVTNTNKLLELLEVAEPGSPTANELRRRFGWEWSGMRLHELYFKNLTKDLTSVTAGGEFEKELHHHFASTENFLNVWKAMGLTRGIGWVALVRDRRTEHLHVIWIGEHDLGNLPGADVLLVMDVWEHAYMTDYGIKRPPYIDAFVQAIDWRVVEKRFTESKK